MWDPMLKCPVCRDVFRDPCFCIDGMTYCRMCISAWVLERTDADLVGAGAWRSPRTNEVLPMPPILRSDARVAEQITAEKCRLISGALRGDSCVDAVISTARVAALSGCPCCPVKFGAALARALRSAEEPSDAIVASVLSFFWRAKTSSPAGMATEEGRAALLETLARLGPRALRALLLTRDRHRARRWSATAPRPVKVEVLQLVRDTIEESPFTLAEGEWGLLHQDLEAWIAERIYNLDAIEIGCGEWLFRSREDSIRRAVCFEDSRLLRQWWLPMLPIYASTGRVEDDQRHERRTPTVIHMPPDWRNHNPHDVDDRCLCIYESMPGEIPADGSGARYVTSIAVSS